MPTFPFDLSLAGNSQIISSASVESVGSALAASFAPGGTTNWVAANRALYVPFRIAQRRIAYKMLTYNGSATNGNFDVGVYDAKGTRLVSGGGAAQTGTSQIQEYDITDTQLFPGLYYMGVVCDGTGRLLKWLLGAAEGQMLGLAQQASAYPLPATATFASVAGTQVPWVAVVFRSTV